MRAITKQPHFRRRIFPHRARIENMKTSLCVLTTLLLAPAVSRANPIRVVQELTGREVAGAHVKLTYTYNVGAPEVATHGTGHSPWVQQGSTMRDTGSGAQSLPILTLCDCHVPIGETLAYRTSAGATAGMAIQVQVLGQGTGDDCLEPCALVDAAAADAGLRDAPALAPGPPAPSGNEGGCALGAGGPSALPLALALAALVHRARRRRS
jgi:hypothetical protein